MRKFFLVLKQIALFYVSYTLISFAIAKFLGAQFHVKNFELYKPLINTGNWTLAWAFFGRSYTYNFFLGIMELISGSMILFKRTRLLGLLLALGIYTNIVLIDFEYEVNGAVQHATIELIIVLIWLVPYLSDLKKYLWDMSGMFLNKETTKNNFLNLCLPVGFILVSAICTLTLHSSKISTEKTIGAYNVLEFSIDGKKQELGQGEYTKKPMLFFESRNVFVLSANDSSYFGKYELKNDSIFVSFDQGFRNIKSLQAAIKDREKLIIGLTNNNQPFELSIDKIRNKNQN